MRTALAVQLPHVVKLGPLAARAKLFAFKSLSTPSKQLVAQSLHGTVWHQRQGCLAQ